MVRCLGVLLALILLLCGCAQETTPPIAPADPTTQAADSASGSGASSSTIEQLTGGAVTSYALESEGYYGVLTLNADVVLMRQEDGEGVLSVYDREAFELIRELRLGQGVIPTPEQMQVTEQGISYFDAENKAIVFLNNDFVENGRMYLSEDVEGSAYISEDWKMVYYCTQEGIYAMDLQTGIARLLKEQTALHQQITGCFGGNGQILRYEVEITEGQKQVQLLDSNSGMVQHEGAHFSTLRSCDMQYFLPQTIRGVRELRFNENGTDQVLWPLEANAEPHMLFRSKAIVMLQQEADKAALTYYDLTTGKRTGAIALENIRKIYNMQADEQSGVVWLLVENTSGMQIVYRWDSGKTPTGDEEVYKADYYTRENPDHDGLTAVQNTAVELGSRFGVEIFTWQTAASLAPADYVFTEEHLAQAYDTYLPQLEQLISALPEGILTQTSGGKLQFALVSKITGEPSWGGMTQSNVLQFWNKDVPVIALVLDEELEQSFYHGVYHLMETQILSKSTALYEWNKLNPSGFDYDNNYATTLERTDTTYIDGEKCYFIDLFSMSYAKEDRARIFEYACMPGNEELFKSPVLQEKLRRICNGIRTAYGLKKVETTFLWEQYLA